MVMGYDLDQIGSKPPAFGEQASALTVREAQSPLLDFVQGNAFGRGRLVGFAEFLRQDPKIDDDSQVMKKTCKICFSRIAQFDLACQVAAYQGASQRVLPEYDWIQAGFVSRQHVENTARHGDVADMMKPQTHHCG